MGILHDRPGHDPVVAFALPADEDVRTSLEPIGFASFTAPATVKALRPTDCLKVGGAGEIVGKKLLELRQRTGEGWVVTGERNRQHGGCSLSTPILPIVALGVNRISIVLT